jgi:hypothetical protein
MSLADQVNAALTALPVPSAGSQTIDVAEAGQRFTSELSAVDSLGCAFTNFTLTSQKLKNAGIDELKRVAEALSVRLTYLLEPVQPIEVDPSQCVIQMRSVPPQKNDNRTSYYELLVRKGGELSLARYAKDVNSSVRQCVPAQVTREVFVRLVQDFSAVS